MSYRQTMVKLVEEHLRAKEAAQRRQQQNQLEDIIEIDD